jgi:hypothetical protein
MLLRPRMDGLIRLAPPVLPAESFGLPGLGYISPYYDADVSPSPWGALDRYQSPRWDVEPYSSFACCGCGLCYGIQAIVRLH